MNERNVSPWGSAREPDVELKLEDVTCEVCGKATERSAMHRTQGQLRCAECAGKVQAAGSQPLGGPIRSQPLGPPIRRVEMPAARAYVAPAQLGSSMVAAAVCGLIGALIGAAVWAAIALAADVELGFVATLVGFLAGVGVKTGAGASGGPAQRMIAVAMAIAGLVAAKYMMFSYIVVKLAHDKGLELGYVGKFVVSKFPGALTQSFSPFDALWLLLAIGAAYRVSRPAS